MFNYPLLIYYWINIKKINSSLKCLPKLPCYFQFWLIFFQVQFIDGFFLFLHINVWFIVIYLLNFIFTKNKISILRVVVILTMAFIKSSCLFGVLLLIVLCFNVNLIESSRKSKLVGLNESNWDAMLTGEWMVEL